MNETQLVVPPCSACGGTVAYRWEVDTGGGWSPKLVPLPMLSGPKLVLQCCLACGLVQWFAGEDTLAALRERRGVAR